METAEAKIIALHNLDTSNLENLAKDIAKKWNYNVEFGAYENHDGAHQFVHYGTAQLDQKAITVTLYDTSKDPYAQHNYVIEFGEEAKIIYNNIIQILPPWEEQYETILQNFQNNAMEDDPYYNGVFDECRKIGADKVYFIKEDLHANFQLNRQSSFENYMETIKNKIPFFEVKLL